MQDMAKVQQEIQRGVDVETQNAVRAAVYADTLVINTDEEYQAASELLMEVQGKWKTVEAKRTEVTKPINQSLRTFNAMFKPAKDQYTRAKNGLVRAMNAFNRMKEEQQAQAMAHAQQASDAGDTESFYMMAQVAAENAAPIVAGVHERETWAFELEDVTKVPVNFLVVNDLAVRAHIKATGGQVQIPGIRIFKQKTVVARTS